MHHGDPARRVAPRRGRPTPSPASRGPSLARISRRTRPEGLAKPPGWSRCGITWPGPPAAPARRRGGRRGTTPQLPHECAARGAWMHPLCSPRPAWGHTSRAEWSAAPPRTQEWSTCRHGMRHPPAASGAGASRTYGTVGQPPLPGHPSRAPCPGRGGPGRARHVRASRRTRLAGPS